MLRKTYTKLYVKTANNEQNMATSNEQHNSKRSKHALPSSHMNAKRK